MTRTTTKNRRAVGTLGLAAVIAVLTVSMIAMNFTSNQAIGEQQGANKVGTAVSMMSFIQSTTQNNGLPDVIIQYEGKASDKHDVLSRVTLECTTATEVKASGAKGKDKSTDSAKVGAVVWFTYGNDDGDYLIDEKGNIKYDEEYTKGGGVPSAYLWHVCGQEMELQVNLNPIIIVCPDPDNLPCHEGQLVFACDVLDLPPEECDQWVQIFLKTWGTHTAVTLINDIPHGDYYVKVWGSTTFEQSGNLDDENLPDRTTVIIGKKFLENTPILMDNPTT